MPDYKIAIKTTSDPSGVKQTLAGLDQIKGKLGEVKIAGTTLGGALTKNGPAAAGAALFAAGGAFLAFAKSSIEAAEEEAKSLVILNAALEATGQAGQNAAEGIGALADAQERATNVSGEVWTEAAAQLIQYGAQVEEIPELFPILEGLAGRMGGDVSGAARALGLALAGQTRGLAQFGVHLEEGATKAEILAAATEKAATGEGVLRGQAETLTGETIALGNAWDEVKTEFGKSITEGGELAKGLNQITKSVLYLKDNMDNALKFGRETLAGLTLGFSETARVALGWGKDTKKASEDVTEATKPVGEFTKANAKAKAGIEELAKAAADASLKAYIDQLKEANRQLEQMEDREKRLASARADQEQARIDGLVKTGLLSPEEGARQKEAAEIENERAALTRQRDSNIGVVLREAGEKATLEDASKKPGANQDDIAKLLRANDARQQQARTAIQEANIRLETNRQKAAAADFTNAAADGSAMKARGVADPVAEAEASKARAAMQDAQRKSFEAMEPIQRISLAGANAGVLGARYSDGATVTGSIGRRVAQAAADLKQGGVSPGEEEAMATALKDLLEIGKLQNADRQQGKALLEQMRRDIELLKQQTKNNRS